MRRSSLVATAIGVLALTSSALAQAPQAQPPARPGTSAPAPAAQQPARPAAAEMTTTGTLAKYDATSRTLTLTTAKGPETIELGAKATIMDGAKALTAADLGAATGKEVTVKYTESAGKKTATSVTLVAKPAASTTPAPGTAKPATPPAPPAR